MAKLKLWLGALLALQAALAAAFYWNDQRVVGGLEQGPLLSFEPGQVDRIVVSDGDNSATLKKTDGEWQLPDLQDLSAAEEKIDGALEKLAELQSGWPVATTDSSHERFEVADDTYQRHIQLYSGGDSLGALYIGTSPGFRKVHVRREGDSDVFAVALNNYDVPAEAEEWLDKTLLRAEEVTRIEGPDYTLEKQGDSWQFAAQINGEDNAESAATLNNAKAVQLANALTTFRIQSVAESAPDVEPRTLTVTDNGKLRTFTFYQQDDNYFVHRDDRDTVFSLSKYDYDRLAGVERDDLVESTDSAPDTDTGDASASGTQADLDTGSDAAED